MLGCTGQRIFGIVKKWNRLTGSGFIAVNGAGPDLPIRTDMLEDVAILIPGAPVLFMVEHKYLNWFDSPHAEILRCMADRESVRQHISTTFGTEMAVRSFARTLQQELQMLGRNAQQQPQRNAQFGVCKI
eukprot:Skav210398  [mRNA]  locus=scaffold1416:83080:86057:+ [translate_table: standard]